VSGALPAPKFDTLLDMLATRAAETPAAVAYTFCDEPRSYGEIWTDVTAFASELRRRGIGPGHRVVMALPNGPEFFAAFYGTQRAGGVAVPIFPGSGLARVASLTAASDAAAIVVAADAPAAQRVSLAERCGLPVLSVDESAGVVPEGAFPTVDPDHVAFLQYTSGTTGAPKGVQLTHANLLTNVEQLIAGMQITRDEVFVSWLPVYHDMGLILKTMVPFYLPAALHLLPASLTDVHSWLDAIQRHRATFTAAPDFAYRLAVRRTREPGRYDLKSLRVALDAAEPVRAETCDAFERAFGLEHVVTAGYGLAEATVGVAMSTPGAARVIDDDGVVSVGPPFPAVELGILHEDALASPGTRGEVLVRSAASSQGYFRNPSANAELFWGDGYIRTGDVGYLDAAGRLYIVDRKKNLIIQAGRNVSPREVEEIVDGLPFVRFTAAAGIDRRGPEGEQVYVFAEIRPPEGDGDAGFEDMTIAIVSAIHSELGIRPGRVYLTTPHTIPLTHNGKKRYGALRESYLDGSLRRDGRLLYPDY
jgi:acyl-CoA synthetase (AMP-forming)/AMP-acid ligase II